MASLNIDALIALVRRRPQLWDRGNKLHSNRHVLDKCWREIAAELRADENKIRKKWKYLRDQFSVEFGKIPPAGCEDEVLSYEPRWRYYRPLQFLEEVVTPRISTKNPKRDGDSSDSMDTSTPNSPTPLHNGAKRTQRKDVHSKKHKRFLRGKKLKRSELVNDEHLHFFKSLLPHVRTIPKHLQLSFRNRIQAVVERYAYRADGRPAQAGPGEPYFITCVPDQAAKFEPPESVDESQDNRMDDDDGSS